MANNTNSIKHLPAVFQTVTERKFFDATFDQVFSKRNAERITGYIGRRVGGEYNPESDFYLPEQTKDRTWYQLEPTEYAVDPTTLEKTNQFFYKDMIDRIRFYNGDVSNHDRLFNSETYSYSPPVNMDKFLNYQNYFWVPNKIPTIVFDNITESDIDTLILGQASFNSDQIPAALPQGVEFLNGLRVRFLNAGPYNEPYTVTGVGSSIAFLTDQQELTYDTTTEFILWDDIDPAGFNEWDAQSWDSVNSQGSTPDYITIERGAIDNNEWSRVNQWYHIDVINEALFFTGTIFPSGATRAQRPIIEFFKNIQMFQSGTQFFDYVDYYSQITVAGVTDPLPDCGPLTYVFDDIQLQPLVNVAALIMFVGSPPTPGQTIVFPCDETTLSFPTLWDSGDPLPTGALDDYGNPILTGNWAGISWDTDLVLDENGDPLYVREFVWRIAIIDVLGVPTVQLSPYKPGVVPNPVDPSNVKVNEGDIILISGGPADNVYTHRSETFYFTNNTENQYPNNDYTPGAWLAATSIKTGEGSFPKYSLYNITESDSDEFVELQNELRYPNNNFGGSEIFSYKVSTDPSATVDSVLGFSVVYKSLGQLSDLMFENDLQSERYSYIEANTLVPITGYYYYRIVSEGDDPTDDTDWVYENSWYLNKDQSEQRVIDRYTIVELETGDYDFIMSVIPLDTSTDNMDVFVNGVSTTNFDFVTVNGNPSLRILDVVGSDEPDAGDLQLNDEVEVFTYTYARLEDKARGYFEIPQQLEANPNNDEVVEQSYGEFTPHFRSIIANQVGFVGNSLGSNNYPETARNPSLGHFILQNESPLTRTMFVSSEDDVDTIKASRFAQNEYVNFKGKFLKVIRQRDLHGFSPTIGPDQLFIDLWLEEVLSVITISREFSQSFAYSYMIGRSDLFRAEVSTVDVSLTHTFDVDLEDPRNTMYLYKVEDLDMDNIFENAVLLTVDCDYTIDDVNNSATVTYLTDGIPSIGDTIVARIYEDAPTAYIPGTPAKLGMAPVYKPGVVLDETYTTPIYVIVGHDGSQTPAFGTITFNVDGSVNSTDIRDLLLYELEKRIYNGIQGRFRVDPNTLLQVENIRPGYFRQIDAVSDSFIETEINRYTRQDYYHITEPFFSKWTAENRADFRINEFFNPVDWKTWNYSSQEAFNTGEKLPGHWRGIYTWMFDTDRPDTNPWEMLGFSEEPTWWETTTDTGDTFTGYGSAPWPNTDPMWADIEQGIIRRGNRAGVNDLFIRATGVNGDPTRVQFTSDPLVPDPIDPNTGLLRAPYAPTPGLDYTIPVDVFGIVRPAWLIFDLLLAGLWDGADDPWKYGDGAPVEQAWYDTSEYYFSLTEFYYLMRPADYGEKFWSPATTSVVRGQILDNITNERLKNSTQVVHAETVNGVVQYRTGYQQHISDRLLFLGKDVSTVFGDKVRTINVNLAYKMGAFTNEDTMRAALQSSSTESATGNLVIPTTNYGVALYTGASIKDYVYSGVVVRANADGTFTIYGYDLLDQTFKVLPAKGTGRAIQQQQGGTPLPFKEFQFNEAYIAGEIVRYNSRFYQANKTFTASSFSPADWSKLPGLPEQGGVQVTYYPDRQDDYVIVPYASIMHSIQDVYDFLIGYGAFLESDGWDFDRTNDLNQVLNWKLAAEQFLFWVVNDWAPDNSLFLSPGADAVTLEVESGYPANVEKLSNGVYSILDKRGVSIPPKDTLINRQDKYIQIVPKDLGTGVYYLRISAKETEHILMFDNQTEFNDTIYLPLLRVRQDRLTFTGIRTLDWFGKLEAGGFLVQDGSLIQNFENLTESIRHYYDTETSLDNPEIEAGARHLIGHENREFLDELDISEDVQLNFYQGFIRQKGTANAVSKLLRSNTIQDRDEISFTEDWAIRVGEFGGIDENISIEFVSKYDDIRSDPQLYRLNYVPDQFGYVKDVVLFNAEDFYATVPTVTIITTETGATPTVVATAVAILTDDNRLARIDIVEPGEGYSEAPFVCIENTLVVTNPVSEQTDVAYTVFQPYILHDDLSDTIVEVDIDNTDQWILRPRGLDPRFAIPLDNKNWLDYETPNAGYVHLDDVDFTAFNADALPVLWAEQTSPVRGQTVWVAKNSLEDWGVYEMMGGYASDLRQAPDAIVTPDDESDWAIVTINTVLFSGTSNENRVRFFNTEYNDTDLNISGYVSVNTEASTTIYKYLYNDLIASWVLVDADDAPISWTDTFEDADLTGLQLDILVNLRFANRAERDASAIVSSNPTWIDNVDGVWRVEYISFGIEPYDEDALIPWDNESGAPGGEYDLGLNNYPLRVQNQIINTNLYENAFVRERQSGDTIVRLPVYDPFKDILPGPAEQNISFKSSRDPARYTNSDDPRLLDSNNLFNARQVGKLWWDQSDSRFIYYEQPPVYPLRDNDAEKTKNLEYRRDNWGKVFPGSSADIYEWVESPVPPDQYVGDGIPKNLTDYVEMETYDTFRRILGVTYYFWVTDKIEKPTNIPNRTLTTTEVSRLLMNPRSLSYRWFSPVQLTDKTNSVIFSDIDRIISNQNTIIQINYKLRESANEEHDQWILLGENDRFSVIPDTLWDKMVDSLVGYSELLPVEEYPQGIYTGVYPKDGANCADVVDLNIEEVVLPVPDPNLSAEEQLGIRIRPQQSMFVNIQAARQIMAQKVNTLMSSIQLWTLAYVGWDDDLTFVIPGDATSGGVYWEYTDWFETGYTTANTTAAIQVANLTELNALLGTVSNGTLIKVYPFIPSATDKYEIYEYVEGTDEFALVRREDGTIRFKDTVYEELYKTVLRNEIREILTTLKNNVFISKLVVNENLLYFALVNYTFSEQRNVDWAFKTTYIKFLQDNVLLNQNPNFEADLLDEFLQYVGEAKPYHTKIRSTTSVLISTIDEAIGTAYDDAFGDYVCVPVVPPFDDPVYPGQEVTQNCYWDNDSITKNLRLFTIKLNYSRVWCTQEEKDEYIGEFIDRWSHSNWSSNGWSYNRTLPPSLENTQVGDCGRLVLSGGDFVLGWDGTPWDAFAILFGFDIITGVPSGYVEVPVPGGITWEQQEVGLGEFTFNWDTLTVDGIVGSEVFFAIVDETDIDASLFGDSGNVPEELVKLVPSEDLVLRMDYPAQIVIPWDNGDITPTGDLDQFGDPILAGNWDAIDWDSIDDSSIIIGYRQHLTPFGSVEFIRTCDAATTTLFEDITPTSTTIDVVDASVLAIPAAGAPGVVWINSERIEYYIVDVNTLLDIRRGTNGTRMAYHSFGDKVNDGSAAQLVPNPNDLPLFPVTGSEPWDSGDAWDDGDIWDVAYAPNLIELPDGNYTPLTDPWFIASVGPGGNIQTDSKGDIIMLPTTPQASFLFNCAGQTSNLYYQYDETYGGAPLNTYDAILPNVINKPTIMFVHFGRWNNGDKQQGPTFNTSSMLYYAQQGYTCVSINYTLGVHRVGIDDVILAKNYFAGLYGQPVIIVGLAAGAHIGTFAAQEDPTDVLGVVGLYGMYDFSLIYPAYGIEFDAQLYQNGNASNVVSPIDQGLPVGPEFLLLHGSQDTTILPEQSEAMNAAFPTMTYVEVDDTHGFSATKYTEVEDFIKSIT